MHFAALIALVVVVALSILASAVPVSSFYPQVTSKRDDDYIITYARSSDWVLDSATNKRGDVSIIQNKRSQPLPAGGVQGTGSNNNQGIASNTGRRSGINTGTSNNKDEVTVGASSDNTKRQAPESDEIFIIIS